MEHGVIMLELIDLHEGLDSLSRSIDDKKRIFVDFGCESVFVYQKLW